MIGEESLRSQGLAGIYLWAHLSVTVSDNGDLPRGVDEAPVCLPNITRSSFGQLSLSQPALSGGDSVSVPPSLTNLSQYNPVLGCPVMQAVKEFTKRRKCKE